MGLLSSQGVRCAQNHVGESLTDQAITAGKKALSTLQTHSHTMQNIIFGHKLHIDQNEKLTHVCAIDGFSRKLVGFVIMSHKKNVTINEHLYM